MFNSYDYNSGTWGDQLTTYSGRADSQSESGFVLPPFFISSQSYRAKFGSDNDKYKNNRKILAKGVYKRKKIM